MFSWFPLFIPLSQPLAVEAGQEIEFAMWRRVGASSVWYEWSVLAPTPLPLHNPGGRSSKIGL